MHKVIITIMLSLFVLPSFAQEESKSYSTEKGKIQGSLLLGDRMFYSTSELYLYRNSTSIDLYPTEFRFSDESWNSNSIMDMIGVELKYFVTDKISVSFVGAGSVNSTPSREYQEGVITGDPVTSIPNYDYIEANLTTRLVGSIGVNYHLKVKNERIQPYIGVAGTFQFAKVNALTPYNGDPADIDAGVRTGQVFGWSPALVAGIEYALAPGFLIGFEIKPVSYYYSGVELFAAPGLSAMTGDNHEFTFLSHPRFKIGFRF